MPRCTDFDSSSPEVIADVIATVVGRSVNYSLVERDGTQRAA
jgi:hypothetical protein